MGGPAALATWLQKKFALAMCTSAKLPLKEGRHGMLSLNHSNMVWDGILCKAPIEHMAA